MKVVLKSIEIIDFMKLRHFTHNFSKGTTLLKGKNKIGKTTILNAITWCLTGKDIFNQSDTNFNVLPKDLSGEFIDETQPSVTLVYEVDGEEKTFQRKYINKKRGSTRERYIDGVPYAKGEFNAEITKIMGDGEQYKLLTNINHFTLNMSSNDQRKEIMKIVKDTSHEEMCIIDKRFEVLKELATMSFDKAFSLATQKKNKAKEEVKTVKNFVKENGTTLAKYEFGGEIDLNVLETQRNEVESKIGRIRKQLEQQSKVSTQLRDLETELSRVNIKISNFDEDFKRDKKNRLDEIDWKIRQSENEIENLNSNVTMLKIDYKKVYSQKENAEKEVEEELKKDVKRINTEYKSTLDYSMAIFNSKIRERENELVKIKEKEIVDTCNMCGQSLPKENVERVKENKQNRIDSIMKEIDELKTLKLAKHRELDGNNVKRLNELENDIQGKINRRVKSYKEQLESITKNGKTRNNEIVVAKNELEILQEQRKEIEDSVPDFSKKEYLFNEKQSVEKDIKALGGNAETISFDDLKIEETTLASINRQLAVKDEYDKDLKRKKELKKELELKVKALKSEETKLTIFHEYLKVKNDLLSKELEKYFSGDVSFKLLDFTQDGTPKNVFKILIDGINFNTNVNTGSKIRAGIQFVNFFQKHYGVTMPIMVDEKTSMSGELPKTKAQVIACVVTEDDKLVIKEIEKGDE